jgi:hypothetical protein
MHRKNGERRISIGAARGGRELRGLRERGA